jgi:S-adenosylmethionine hydrolase
MIALISDFGLSDVYVGVMKSVILGITPGAVIVDITHDIPAQNIRAGSFALRAALPTFPAGTIAVVVVDPGVGSERLPIAVRSGKSWIIAPNNGVISGIAFDEAVVLNKQQYHRPRQAAMTFHGRDIFAPVAAHLYHLQDLNTIGSPIVLSAIVGLERTAVSRTDTTLIGEMQHVDRFGNIITNITPDILMIWASDAGDFNVSCASVALPARRARFYDDTEEDYDGLLLIPSSFGFIEIAARGKSASKLLGGVQAGQGVTIKRV